MNVWNIVRMSLACVLLVEGIQVVQARDLCGHAGAQSSAKTNKDVLKPSPSSAKNNITNKDVTKHSTATPSTVRTNIVTSDVVDHLSATPSTVRTNIVTNDVVNHLSATPSTARPTTTTTTINDGVKNLAAGNIKSAFSYQGANGGRPGSYDMVTDIKTCAKQPHQTSSAVSPFDDDVTLVFRGPMTIHNIAVFDGSSGNWHKVSSYQKDGQTNNMVFLNNNNIDYTGVSSPEGFSGKNGKDVVQTETAIDGELAGATNPGGFLASEKTGTEVHVMSGKKCGSDAECLGYHDHDGTAHLGWPGTKKVFITKVHMPHGPAPNLPAVWMLNGQIVRSNQYQCNCRGMGKAGGCGELDIAEVIERDPNVVATHYYFYDGNPAPGKDDWSKRPVDGPTTYITIIDDAYGVKVVEIGAEDFDFDATSIPQNVIAQWLGA